jgi:small subunit ribosomal protein S8
MTMTDPIADMLTRLRNANQAYHDAAAMPSSKLKTHVAEILQKEGYIGGWTVNDVEVDGHIRKVLGGLGVAIISTSTGLLTDKQANKKGVGGEVLAYVW